MRQVLADALDWIWKNKEWIFGGVGLPALAYLGNIVRKGINRWRERPSARLDNDPELVPMERVSTSPRPLRARLPAFLVRSVTDPEKVLKRVEIRLREETPIYVSLGAAVPMVDIYFEIANHSTLDLVLDRMLVEVWFGQPTFNGAILRRHPVPAEATVKSVYFRHMLADTQARQIKAFTDAPQGNMGSLHIYLIAYFESKVGRLVVEKSIERQRL